MVAMSTSQDILLTAKAFTSTNGFSMGKASTYLNGLLVGKGHHPRILSRSFRGAQGRVWIQAELHMWEKHQVMDGTGVGKASIIAYSALYSTGARFLNQKGRRMQDYLSGLQAPVCP